MTRQTFLQFKELMSRDNRADVRDAYDLFESSPGEILPYIKVKDVSDYIDLFKRNIGTRFADKFKKCIEDELKGESAIPCSERALCESPNSPYSQERRRKNE